jgi:hypothetical protein
MESETNEHFKIPISYNSKVQKLNKSVLDDLELTTAVDKEKEDIPIYHEIFNVTFNNSVTADVVKQISESYTTDVEFLKETQDVVHEMTSERFYTTQNKHTFENGEHSLNDLQCMWKEIRYKPGFCEKYYYVDWEFAKELNNNSHFLQLLSIYNIASPVLSLCLPIFVLIVPLVVIKIKGIHLSIKEYFDILKTVISNHPMFKIFSDFNNVSGSQRISIVTSAVFYAFSIFQNILTCIRFYSNMHKIHEYFNKMNMYLKYTLDMMNEYETMVGTLGMKTYMPFIVAMQPHKIQLKTLQCDLQNIDSLKLSFTKLMQLGKVMHLFYQMHSNDDYHKSIMYSFGFNGYIYSMQTAGALFRQSKMKPTTFVAKGKPNFKGMYYPKFVKQLSQEIVKNDCKLNKNMIITGPNASGKTTTLKTALINIILSQQIGFGCFDSLKLAPFDKLHCYLNIPDTSGRDSLFQAEARRCKDIIDCIDDEKNANLTHFCIFDELYSGTNPDEAVVSANAFMDYLVKKDNITCILTTHYTKLCKKLAKNKMIKNYNMKTVKKNDNFEYTYEIEEGISKIKGGLKVLRDMKYPKEILDLAK